MKLKRTLRLIGVLLFSIPILTLTVSADEIKKESIVDKIEAVTESKYSDFDKISSLLDLYDQQVEAQHEVQDYITTLTVEIENKEAEINKLEEDINTNAQKANQLAIEIADKQTEIKQQEVEMQQTQEQIDLTQIALDETTADVDNKKQQVANYYRAVQIETSSGHNTMLSVLLNAENLTDLINRGVSMTRLQTAANARIKSLNDSLAKQEKVKQTLQVEKDKQERQRQSIDEAKKDLEHQKKQVDNDSQRKQQVQSRIDREQKNLETKIKQSEAVIKEAEANAKAVEMHFATLTDRLVNYQATIQDMIDNATSKKHREILSDVYKRIEAIKPPEVTGLNQTWRFSTTSLDKARQKLVEVAITQLGVNYVWGGNVWGSALDCSSLTQGIYQRALGIDIQRVTTQQESKGKSVSATDLKTGDLIFWGPVGATTHVGMYIGDGVYIHAPQPGETVTYSKYGIESASTIRRIIE